MHRAALENAFLQAKAAQQAQQQQQQAQQQDGVTDTALEGEQARIYIMIGNCPPRSVPALNVATLRNAGQACRVAGADRGGETGCSLWGCIAKEENWAEGASWDLSCTHYSKIITEVTRHVFS